MKSLSTNLGLGFLLSWIIVFVASAGFAQHATGDKQSTTGQSTRRRVPTSSATTEGTSEFFGLRVGSRWVYTVHGKRTGDGEHAQILPINGSYTEEIVSMRNFGSHVRLVEFVAEGFPVIYERCSKGDKTNSGDHEKMRFWYIVDRKQVRISCTQEEANQTAKSLAAAPSGRVSEDDPDYLLPFKVGASWGADPSEPKRTDSFYQWNVEAMQDLILPAGRFKGCYELTYRTLPDHEYKWVCSGAGLVVDEYQHHGTVDEYRVELQSYTPGPISPVR